MALMHEKQNIDHSDVVLLNDNFVSGNSTRSTFKLFLMKMRYLISDIPHLIRTSLKKTYCNITIIGSNTALKGNFNTKNDIHIYGRHEGNIETTSQLYIGRDAYIIANIKCRKVVIHGMLYGNIEAEHAEILATATVNGNITARSLSLQSGAHLHGKCRCPKLNSETAPLSLYFS